MTPTRRRLTRADFILLGLTVVALLATALITSAKKYLWYDELFGWTFATDPSLWHALRAVGDGADIGPPLMYVVNWLWVGALGSGETTFRAVSALSFAAAVVVLWLTLRRAYPVRAVALGVVTAVLASADTAYQFSEGRFYGLLTLAVVVALALYAASDQEGIPFGLQVGTTVAHAAVIYVHAVGLLYSGVLLLATVARDATRGRVRVGRYVPILIAWLTFVPWLPAVRRQSDLSKPHPWVSPPNLTTFGNSYLFGISPLPFVLLLVIALGAIVRAPEREDRLEEDRSLLIAAAALLAVPIAAFVVSHAVAPIFLPRYFVPAAIGWAIVIAHLGQRAEPAHGRITRPLVLGLWTLMFAVLIAKPVGAAITMARSERPGTTIDRLVPPNIPVVVGDAINFLAYAHYSARPAGYYYVLDWAAAMDPHAEREATMDYKVMDAWRRNGLLSSRIVPEDAFLRDHAQFVVLRDTTVFEWYDYAINGNPRFTTQIVSKEVPTFGRRGTAVLVRRVAP